MSIFVSAVALLRASEALLRVSYGLAGFTLTSGVVLALVDATHAARLCVSGLAYFVVVGVLLLGTHRKLVSIRVNQR